MELDYTVGDTVFAPDLIGCPKGEVLEITTEMPKDRRGEPAFDRPGVFTKIMLQGQLDPYPMWVHAEYWKKWVKPPKNHNPFADFIKGEKN